MVSETLPNPLTFKMLIPSSYYNSLLASDVKIPKNIWSETLLKNFDDLK